MLKLSISHSPIRLKIRKWKVIVTWTLALQMDGSSPGRSKFLSIPNPPPLARVTFTVSSFLLLPSIPYIVPHFLFFSKDFHTVKTESREPQAKLGKKLISSRGHEGSDEAAGFFSPLLPSTWTAWRTNHLHSPSLAALLSLPGEQA